MSASGAGNPVVDDYMCEVDFQPGWVNLTLEEPSSSVADKLAWKEVEGFNPLKLTVSKNSLAKEMARLAYESKKERSVLTGAYYTDRGNNLANLEVKVFGEEGVRPTPAEVQPMLLEKKNAEVVGEPEVTYLDIPLGSAVRVQATFKAKGVLGFGRRLIESVTYAVCPTIVDDVVVAAVRWESFEFTEDLTRLADELLPTLRLIPFDENGNEIDLDLLR